MGPQRILVPEVIPPQIDFAFIITEVDKIPLCPVLQLVKIPLNGGSTSQHISQSSQCCVVCEPHKGALCSFVQVVNEDGKEYLTQY